MDSSVLRKDLPGEIGRANSEGKEGEGQLVLASLSASLELHSEELKERSKVASYL